MEIRHVGRPLPEAMVLAPLRLRARTPVMIEAGATAVGLLGYLAYRQRDRLGVSLKPIERRLQPLASALRPLDRAIERWSEAEVSDEPGTRTALVVNAMTAATFPIAIKNREDRGRTVRGVRIRRVDLRTGGPITLRGAIVHYFASIAVDEAFRLIKGKILERNRARISALYPQLDLLRPQYEGDPDGLDRAWKTLLHEHGINTLRMALKLMALRRALDLLPVLLPPRHQSLPDILAGIVTVVDQPEPAELV